MGVRGHGGVRGLGAVTLGMLAGICPSATSHALGIHCWESSRLVAKAGVFLSHGVMGHDTIPAVI